jgi:osmotically-inducible protein OsmY
MATAKLSRKAAIAYIRQRDNERRHWAKLIYGVNWEDPAQYHAVLNISQLSPASAVETIVRLSELPEFKPTEEGQKRFDDLRLSCRVWGALARNPETRASNVQIMADGGKVLITGNIGSGKALDLVPKIAKEVSGVEAVHCEAGVGTDWSW